MPWKLKDVAATARKHGTFVTTVLLCMLLAMAASVWQPSLKMSRILNLDPDFEHEPRLSKVCHRSYLHLQLEKLTCVGDSGV